MNINELIPDSHNANKGTPRGRGMLEKSLQKYGAGRSILLDKNNRIIAGNKTTEAAGGIGMEKVRIVESDGKEIITVKRTDLDLETDKAARELAFADNRTSEVSIEWQPEEIARAQVEGCDLSNMFNADELNEIEGSETERLNEQEKNIEPYKKVHVLISIDVDKIQNIGDALDNLRKIEGVEIETKAN